MLVHEFVIYVESCIKTSMSVVLCPVEIRELIKIKKQFKTRRGETFVPYTVTVTVTEGQSVI